MSADNWAICPQCLDEALAESATAFQEAIESYGKVSPEEYEALRAKAQEPIDEEKFRTFREDYEFYGVKSGVLTIDYSGHCQKCKCGTDFRQTVPFYAKKEGSAS